MNKKTMFNLLIVLSSKSNCCTWLMKINEIEDIDNFNSFVEKISNEKKAKKKELQKKIKNDIIDEYKKLQTANFKNIDIQCLFTINIYDGTKKYISEITEKGNLIFSDFNEIPQDGVKNVKKKNFIIINGKKNDTTISIIIFKELPENKKINKNGELEDDC